MADRAAPSLRQVEVQLDCSSEQEFLQRFAPEIAAKGLRVELADLPRVGSRVAVAIAFADGQVVARARGFVTGKIDERAVRVRLTELDPGGIAFELSPGAALHAASALAGRVTPAPAAASPAAARPPTPPPVLISVARR